MKRKITALLLLFASSAYAEDEHLSRSFFESGGPDNDVLLLGGTEYIRTVEVIPKPGNMTWTSIKTCLSTHYGQRVTGRVFLRDTETGEFWYWHHHEGAGCDKEVFDIPIHTNHKMELQFKCMSYGSKKAKNYCRLWAHMSSQIIK